MQKVHYLLRYEFKGKNIAQLQVTSVLPKSIPGYQNILTREYSLTPNLARNAFGDSVGIFYFFSPSDSVAIEIQGEAELFPDTNQANPQDSAFAYFRSILSLVPQKIQYQLQTTDLPLDSALKKGVGDCTEFAAYAARLCSQKGYPTRRVSGIHLRQGVIATHSWAECQHPNGSWIHLDPTWASETSKDLGHAMIRNLQRPSWYLTLVPSEPATQAKRWVSFQYAGDSISMKTIARIIPLP